MQPAFKEYIKASTEKIWVMFMEEAQQLSQVQSGSAQFGLYTKSKVCHDTDISKEFDENAYQLMDEILTHVPDTRPLANRFSCSLPKYLNSSDIETLIRRMQGASTGGNFIETDTSITNYHDDSQLLDFSSPWWIRDYPY